MEFLDVLDEHGELTGVTKSREKVHQDGDWYRGVSIWLLNDQKQLLFQKRSQDKISFPGLWETSCSGHVLAGEDFIEAAKRELKEELDLDVKPEELKFLFEIKETHLLNDGAYIINEFKKVYLLITNLNTFNFQYEEISEVKWFDIDHQIIGNKDFVPHPEEYKKLFKLLT